MERTYRSNAKIVIEKIRRHIQVFYNLEDLKNEVNAFKRIYNISSYLAGQKLVEYGSFLVYYSNVREFLESLNLNNKSGKSFSDYDCWKMYKHLLAREIAKIIEKGEFK